MTDNAPATERSIPDPVTVCHCLFTHGGAMSTVEFGRAFDLTADIAKRGMKVQIDLNGAPCLVDDEKETISLSLEGERVCRVAQLLASELGGKQRKLADAVLRFLVAKHALQVDTKEQSLEDCINFHFGLVRIFLGEETGGPFDKIAGEAWGEFMAYYIAAHPEGWEQYKTSQEAEAQPEVTRDRKRNMTAVTFGHEVFMRGGSAPIADILSHFGFVPAKSQTVLRILLKTDHTPLCRKDEELHLTDEARSVYEKMHALLEEAGGDMEKFAYLVVANFLVDEPSGSETLDAKKAYVRFILEVAYEFLTPAELEVFRQHSERLTRPERKRQNEVMAGAVGCEVFRRGGSAPIDELFKHFGIPLEKVDSTIDALLSTTYTPLRREGDLLILREEAVPLYEKAQELYDRSEGKVWRFAFDVIDHILDAVKGKTPLQQQNYISRIWHAACGFLSPDDREEFRKHAAGLFRRKRGEV